MPRTLIRPRGADRERSLGWLAVWWIESFVVHGPGDVEGQPIVHGDEYTGFIVDCYSLDDEGGRLVDSSFISRPKGCNKSGLAAEIALFEALGPCRFDGWAKGGETFKYLGREYVYEPGEPMGRPVRYPMVRIMATEEDQPLALDTPIPTPEGWTTVQDLHVGDYVFDSQGRPTRVARETPVFTDLDTYRVKFSDGEEIIASGSHAWTLHKQVSNHQYQQVTVSTEEMARGGKYKLHTTPAWDLPEADLPVDPYFLGLWLGDGKARDSSVVFHKEDHEMYEILESLATEGEEVIFRPSKSSQTVSARFRRRSRKEDHLTLRSKLRDIGVLGNKHIPQVYLRASIDQRKELLKGLMDSDGGLSSKGQATFTNTNPKIIEGFKELLISLGYKFSVVKGSTFERVKFQPTLEDPVCKLDRKISKHWPASNNPRSVWRHVTSVEQVPSVPVKCIGIDTEDHLFAAGRHGVLTHNTGNTYDMIYLNLTEGPLSQLKAYGLDAGKTRTLLPEGGEIMPSSSGAASKDGGKETFVVFDETHLYNTNALRSMYKTVSRNLVKRRKSAGTWYIETTTMYAPGEDSVAEHTYEYAQAIAAGKTKRSRMLYDHRWGDIKDLRVEDDLRKAIVEAYGDALEWVSLEGVVDDILDIRRDESESRRYFLNALTEASNAWLSPELISLNVSDQIIFPGEQITLGFDGALTKDSTALVGCRVSDGHLFTIALEECPDGPAAREWMVDTELIDSRVRGAFEEYEVVGFFADPPYWQEYIDEWERDFGEELQIKANNRSPIKWWTKRDTQMSQALDRLKTALKLSTTSLADDPDMRRHFLNAREWNRRGGSVIGKETKNSPRKIDLAMAATLAFEARAHYLAENVGEEDSWIPIRIA